MFGNEIRVYQPHWQGFLVQGGDIKKRHPELMGSDFSQTLAIDPCFFYQVLHKMHLFHGSVFLRFNGCLGSEQRFGHQTPSQAA